MVFADIIEKIWEHLNTQYPSWEGACDFYFNLELWVSECSYEDEEKYENFQEIYEKILDICSTVEPYSSYEIQDNDLRKLMIDNNLYERKQL